MKCKTKYLINISLKCLFERTLQDYDHIVSLLILNNDLCSQIIDRDGFKYQKDFVGHRKAVTCVRKSLQRSLLKIDKKRNGKQKNVCF